MSACNKRKQIKPQKIFEKNKSTELINEIDSREKPLENTIRKSEAGSPCIEAPNYNDLFNQKLKDLLQVQSMIQTQTQTDFIQLIEKIILKNLMPIFTSLTNLKTNSDTPVVSPEPTNSIEKETVSPPKITNGLKTNTENQTDLIKKSIDKFFSDNDTKVNYLKEPSKLDTQNQLLLSKQNKINENNSHVQCDLTGGMQISSNTLPVKMVRGQEEWVNNPRQKSFISQILKCLECSASFDSLADLSVHMLNSNHFLKFQANNSNFKFENHLNASKQLTTTIPPGSDNQKQSHSDYGYSTKNSSQKNSNEKTVTKCITSQNKSETFGACKLKGSIPFNKTCQICNKTFDHLAKCSNSIHQQVLPPLVRLIQHLKNAHKIIHICTNCGAYFNTSEMLQSHLIEESYSYHYAQQGSRKQVKTQSKIGRKNEENLDIFNFRKRSVAKEINCDSNKHHKASSHSNLSVSVSPTFSTGDSVSSASHSANSSPNSFVSESPVLTNQKSPKNEKNQEEISRVQSSNTGNHLLALQMLVNGNSKSCTTSTVKTRPASKTYYVLNKVSTTSLQYQQKQQANKEIKLPAKKRPYVEVEKDLSNYVPEDKRLKTSEILLGSNSATAKENACGPLNLLQKMHRSLDDYFTR